MKLTKNKNELIILSELFFNLLPFIVIFVVKLSLFEFQEMIYTSTWSIASTILFGQVVFKLTLGTASYEKGMEWKKFGLLIAFLIVFCLVPSSVIMTLFLINEYQNIWIIGLNFFFLILSIVIYYLLGTVGQDLSSNYLSRKLLTIINKE